uniref:Uncharacterized protein n=1 Tax=Ditylenchus dipsaci TaxID=166011 RepID=A0A915DCQ1_9BILA
MQSRIERQKKRGIAREWIPVKECSSKEDTDNNCRRSSSYNKCGKLPSAKRGIFWFHVCQDFNEELPKSKIYENACNEVNVYPERKEPVRVSTVPIYHALVQRNQR